MVYHWTVGEVFELLIGQMRRWTLLLPVID